MDATPVHLCSYLTQNNNPPPPPRQTSSRRPLFTIYQGPEISAEEARSRVLRLASSFTKELKLLPGERIATLAHVTPYHLETLLAATAAGCIAAPLNWRWSVSEVCYAVDHIQATVLCADNSCVALAKQVMDLCPSLRVLLILGGSGLGGGVGNDVQTSNREESRRNHYRIIAYESLILSTYPSAPPFLQLEQQQRQLLQPDDGSAFIIFTSGTTGPPKAAVLSHAALYFQCNAKLHCCNYNSSDIYLHTAQLFHVGGLCSALAMLLAGAQHVFLPVFRAAEALKAIEMYNITSFIAVPTMMSDLLAAAATAAGDATEKTGEKLGRKKNFPQVQSVLVGAGGLSPTLVSSVRAVLPNARVYAAYGMTEACSSLTFSTLIDKNRQEAPGMVAGAGAAVQLGQEVAHKHPRIPLLLENNKNTSGVYVGCSPPGIELAILTLTEDMKNKIKVGGIFDKEIFDQGYGEVLTRGPHTMLKYWNDPEATSANFLPGGWMKTGDLGYLNTTNSTNASSTNNTSKFDSTEQKEQHLWLIGRAKDVIKSGGENVPAGEVERALRTHPSVAVAAVVGVPDSRLGERVAAVVVLNSGYTWIESKVEAATNSAAANSSQGVGCTNSSTNRSTTKSIDGALLQQHCRSVAGLAGFKLPRAFFLFENDDEIPRNATGKVVKPQLRDMCIKKLKTATAAAVVETVRSRL